MGDEVLLPEILNPRRALSYVSPYHGYSYTPIESPATTIAKTDAKLASDLIREISKHSLYKSLGDSSQRIANEYMGYLRAVNSPVLRSSSELIVDVERKVNTGLRRIFLGEEESGFTITIRLR